MSLLRPVLTTPPDPRNSRRCDLVAAGPQEQAGPSPVNEAYQHLRQKRRRQHHPLVYEPIDKAVGGDERAEQKELMEQALARLDPELRSICLLREIDDLSYREIAETLEIPEGTVGSRLNRARRELKEHLIHLGWEL